MAGVTTGIGKALPDNIPIAGTHGMGYIVWQSIYYYIDDTC